MRETEPKVRMIAHTAVDAGALGEYLDDIGADEYELDALISDTENLIKVAGKICYKSFQAGLNKNISRVRDDSQQYISNINKVGHGSVIEHGSVTFVIWDCSRVVTHELVRHRAGTAMSQESGRYVRLNNIGFWIPSCLKSNEEGLQMIYDHIADTERLVQHLEYVYDVDGQPNFSKKKELTSALRRVAPIGMATAIVWTMNMRAARHIIQMRTSRHAEEEIRLIFSKIADVMVPTFPALFSDFYSEEVSGINEWKCRNAAMPYDGEQIKRLEERIKELEKDNESMAAQLRHIGG